MPLSETELVLRMLTAAILGGIIGYERELREQPAGLRTHLIVALAAATFMIVSTQFVHFQHYKNDGLVHVDAGRIASNVVVGIGFLGGGAIMHFGLRVRGLTTAASLWLVSALGLAAGSGMLLIASMVTAISLFALVALRYLVEAPRKLVVRLSVRLDMKGRPPSRAELAEYLQSASGTLMDVDFRRDLTVDTSRMNLKVKLPNESYEELLLQRLEELPGTLRVKIKRLDL